MLNAAIADTVTDLLRGPVTNGTASKTLSDFGRPAAGKTGTTDNNADVWFVGYTPQLATAVWIGHTDGIHPLKGFGSGPVFGGTVPASIWKSFMKPALDGQPALDFPVPGAAARPGHRAVRRQLRRPERAAAQRAPGPGPAERLRRAVHRHHAAHLAATAHDRAAIHHATDHAW